RSRPSTRSPCAWRPAAARRSGPWRSSPSWRAAPVAARRRRAQDARMEQTAPANPPSVVNSIVYAGDGTHRDVPLGRIGALLARDPGSFAWIGLYEPDDAVLERLQEQFGLHDLAIEDAHKAHQRPKLEGYGNSFFLVASTAQVVGRRIAYGETHVFFGPRYLITVR